METILAWVLTLAFAALFGLVALLAALGALPAIVAALLCTVCLPLGWAAATLADGGAA